MPVHQDAAAAQFDHSRPDRIGQDSDERTDQENTSAMRQHPRVLSPPPTGIKDKAFNSQEPFNKNNPQDTNSDGQLEQVDAEQGLQ